MTTDLENFLLGGPPANVHTEWPHLRGPTPEEEPHSLPMSLENGLFLGRAT